MCEHLTVDMAVLTNQTWKSAVLVEWCTECGVMVSYVKAEPVR
jgi:hypothetical protein